MNRPIEANCFEIAKPMPAAAPVITATEFELSAAMVIEDLLHPIVSIMKLENFAFDRTHIQRI